MSSHWSGLTACARQGLCMRLSWIPRQVPYCRLLEKGSLRISGPRYHPRGLSMVSSYLTESTLRRPRQGRHTILPARTTLPSADHASVKASPPTSTRLTQFFERTSQKRTVPSAEQLASSDSFTGLNATCSIPEVCPRSSVEYLTSGRSGFHIRRVRSADPVAMS
jgi:hypothetical protein